MFRLIASVLVLVAVVQAEKRVVGGLPVLIDHYPYQAAFEHLNKYLCGASIITPNKVLTAARCTIGKAVADVQVRAGTSFKNHGGQVVKVKTIHQHPDYDTVSMFDNNVAVLTLKTYLVFGPTVRNVVLADYDLFAKFGQTATITGWGTPDTVMKDQLHAVFVNKFTTQECEKVYEMPPGTMCYGFKYGVGPCDNGDQGSPLVSNGIQVGIYSWAEGCAEKLYPGVYTNVADMRYFIDQYI